MIKSLLQEMFILKEKGYYKQAIEILYKLLEMFETPEESIEIFYELAEVYFYSGNIERANHYVEKIIEINPNHTDAIKLQIKLLGNKTGKRIEVAKKLFELTNKTEDMKLYLALLNKAGRYEETISYAESEFCQHCYQEIAEAFYSKDDFSKAKEILEAQDSLTEMGELLLARICYKINDEDSLRVLETKLANSKNPEVIKFIIRLEYDMMNYNKVIELSEKICLTNSAEMLYIVGQAYLFKNMTINAKKLFNILCELVPHPKYFFALALAYIQSNQTTQALEMVKNNTNYLKLITLILNENSISKRVLSKEFLSIMDILSNDELALFKVIEISFKHNLLSIVDNLLKITTSSQNLRYRFYSIKQKIRNKNFEEADRLVKNYRNNESFAMLYAELLDLQNKFKQLEALLEQRESYEKDEFEQCCYYYARIFESKGEYERAIDIAQKGLDFVNNYAEMYYTLLYGLYKRIGDLRTAIECLEKASKYNPDLRPKLVQEAAEL